MSRKFAIVQNGIVGNVIIADSWADGIDVTDMNPHPGPGWTYNGTVFAAPPPPPQVTITQIERADLLARMTPTELHKWRRAAARALIDDSPTIADMGALYAWEQWEAMLGDVNLTSDYIQGLGGVWVSLGMRPARAAEILAPTVK